MKQTAVILSLSVLLASNVMSQSQRKSNARLVGGPCEGCEAVFEYGDRKLSPVDTLPDFSDRGPRLMITGTIFQADGSTPAEGVILYIYHADQNGIYATRDGETGWARRHGYIRGWVRTGKDGRYRFYTLKPGVYPNRAAPAHIHPIILEPNGKYYWLGSYHFDGDPLLTARESSTESPRGGSSGLLSLRKEGNLWVGERDIILGKNIPAYDR
jgi:protocatechuate 3,4-dioxygenase beta subunit